MTTKSSVEKIRERFDKDVERFSNLETGQVATMDAALCMELMTEAAAATTPGAKALLDIGCGAGNYTLKMLQWLPKSAGLSCTLVDLSRPMLDRAVERIRAAAPGVVVEAIQGDMREIDLGQARFDVILAAATLHHLRTDAEWRGMFMKIFAALRPRGTFWVFDMVEQVDGAVQGMMRQRYQQYLAALKGGGEAGEAYAKAVFSYVEEEDTPRPLPFQLGLMGEVGFQQVDILHKNSLFATFGGQKPGTNHEE